MFTSSRFAKKSVERVITSADCFVARHLTIRLNAMLEAEELPASVSNLNASLSEVKAESLTHFVIGVSEKVFLSGASGADNKSAVRNSKQRPTT
jgi:hypothetical protein